MSLTLRSGLSRHYQYFFGGKPGSAVLSMMDVLLERYVTHPFRVHTHLRGTRVYGGFFLLNDCVLDKSTYAEACANILH